MEEIDLIKVLIDNVDVTDSLLIRDVDYVDYARGKVDLLEINLSNIDKDWEKWGLKIDQEIEVIYISDKGEYSTKIMFVDDFKVTPGGFKILAKSINLKSKTNTTRVWENVTLDTIFNDIASRYGFTYYSYDTINYVYSRVEQHAGDFSLLGKLAEREGYSIKIFDKRIILFNDKIFESKSPIKTIKRDEILGNYNVNTKQNNKYSKLVINSSYGKVEEVSEDIVGGTKELYEGDIYISSLGEGQRFAKNLLYKINQDYQNIILKIDGDASIAAGNTVNISGFDEYDGKYFIEENRVHLDNNFFMDLALRRVM